MKITHDFPGANIRVLSAGPRSVTLEQDLRDTIGEWFYWCIDVSEAGEGRADFHFAKRNLLGKRGPAVSLDGGTHWRWLGTDCVHGDSFTYTFSQEAPSVRFSVTMSYTEAHWRRFLRPLLPHPHAQASELCRSRQGRSVEMLRLGCTRERARRKVVVTCRHHSCETMASYALEGFVGFFLSPDPAGAWLRQNVECLVIPFVDKDGVETGDQGKNRAPRDHNRDYDGESLYPETAAIRQCVPEWSEHSLDVALDLHCPWLFGDSNETLYLVGSSDERIWEEQKRYSEILERVQRGPLTFASADNLPYGAKWNVPANFALGKSFAAWAAELPGIRLCSAFEIPYADARGQEVNSETARAFGCDLARALAVYLQGFA